MSRALVVNFDFRFFSFKKGQYLIIYPFYKENFIIFVLMIKKEIIKEIILDFQNHELNDVKSRDIEIPKDSGKIITLVGFRRSGKTYILFDTINQLKKTIPKEKIVYINFEDERFDLKLEELDVILQAYRELFPDINLNEVYFFFDEIQNVEGWERFVRRVYDSISKNIYITGSNSKLLSIELASALRGRALQYEVFPLSFKEFLSFKDIDSKKNDSKNKALIINAFNDYILKGGFPEVINMPESLRVKTIQEYFYVMLYKDLIERFKINSPNSLKYFFERILNGIGKPLAVNKIYNEIKSNGGKISKNTLYEYLDYAESIFYALKVPKFDYSLLKKESSEKKYYTSDNGLLSALSYSFSDDKGALLENIVALHLIKNNKDRVFYYKNGNECDFIIKHNIENSSIVQVSYDLSSKETLNRELAGAIAACKYFKVNTASIITNESEKELIIDNYLIKIIPAWKYLLKI